MESRTEAGIILPPGIAELFDPIDESSAVRARQVPQPCTYHILCILPDIEKTFSGSSIEKASTTVHYEEVMSPVLFVVAMGPDCYKDKVRFPNGPSCRVGDFILVRPNSGTRLKIHGREFRLINDDNVEAVVEDPRGISRL